MKWQDVCENKYLQDLPFKIELNRFGQITMSPAKKKHSVYQGEIEYLLRGTTSLTPPLDSPTQPSEYAIAAIWVAL